MRKKEVGTKTRKKDRKKERKRRNIEKEHYRKKENS